MSQLMTEATADALQKVGDLGLHIIDALAESAESLAMSADLCQWLAAAVGAELMRRDDRPAAHPLLNLQALSNERLVKCLCLSACLVEAATEPLAEQFLSILHKGVIGEVSLRLLGVR